MNRLAIRLGVVLSLLCSLASAQGPDVIVGALPDFQNYTPAGGFHAYAVGTTSCNVGTANLAWVSSTNDHPLIAQQMYRVRDGVFRMVGRAWLKHGFGALQQNLCGTCTPSGTFSALGVGCSDPYGAGLNGQASSLGPRFEVNPSTGVFPYPFTLQPTITDSTSARLRVDSSLVSNQPASARFFVEGHYIAKDDSAAGNDLNNASYREMNAASDGTMTLTGTTVQTQAAIHAWQTVDPGVAITTHDVQGDGRYILGTNAIPLGGGMTRYVFALHNLNSDLAASSFNVAMPAGATVTNLEFLDVDYHSGSPLSGADWTGAVGATGVSWTSPDTFSSNANGAALRWASCHTFVFESDTAPGDVTVGLFKNGGSFTFGMAAQPDWETNSAEASLTADGLTNNGFIGPISATYNFGSQAAVTFGSNVTTAGSVQDIFFQAGSAVSAAGAGGTYPGGAIVNLDLSLPFQQLWNWQPTTSGAFTWTAPSVTLDIVAQLAVTDAASAAGFHVSAAVELSVSACAANTVTHAIGDDDSVMVTIGPGGDHSCLGSVSAYGTSHTSFFINSNGSVSFGLGSTAFSASEAEFLSEMPRIAGCWTDLDPSSGGSVTSTSTVGGDLTVSFQNVPPWSFFGTTNSASFDIALDAGGSIMISGLAGTIGGTCLTGFSPGGGATANPVTWSSLVGSSNTYGTTDAVFETSSGVTGGFSNLILQPSGVIDVN